MRKIVFADPRPLVTPNTLWSAWTIDLSLLIPLVLAAWVYIWGMRKVWARAGAGHGITCRRAICFFSAILALIVALVSPLDALSAELFSAHMVQHLILILIAAPMLVSSDFPLALLWALPQRRAQALGRRLNQAHTLTRAWQLITHPISAWLAFTLALWVWHTPVLF